MFIITILLVLTMIALVYIFLIWNFDYWKKRGVKSPKPTPFLGNYPNIYSQKQHTANDLDDIYQAYKKNEDFVGIFSCRTPQLLILNPKLIQQVLVNDFKHFHDNEGSTMADVKTDFIFANNPFALTGEEWKERRAELTPGLTVSRIKAVYPVTTKICNTLTEYLKAQTRIAPKDGIDTKDLSLRFTSEVVTDCVLGIEAGSFNEKPTLIMTMIKKVFEESFSLIFYGMATGLFPILAKFYKARIIQKDVETFYTGLMQNAIDLRKKQANQHDRVDFLNYMLQLQEKKQCSTLQVTAHSMTFLLDGFETTAVVITHCLLLIARYPETQDKLRAEIEKNLNTNGEIEFDTLSELPYLDACIHESIRLFPPGFSANKLCTEPIELTNKNGNTVRLEKNATVVLPLYSIMTDEDFYKNANEFQPERFLDGNVKKLSAMGLFYGFGGGPRICIGMRFGLTQTKAAIVEIVQKFKVTVNPKTRTDNKLDPKEFLPHLDGGIWLDYEFIK